jgi:hypothetical protein
MQGNTVNSLSFINHHYISRQQNMAPSEVQYRMASNIPISVSQMIMVMLHLSYALSGPLLIHDLSPRVTRFLVGFVLLDLSFSVWCFLDRCLFFCPFCLWPLWCLSFDLRFLIAPLVSSNSSCVQSFSCLLAFYKSNIYHTDLQKYIHTCICIKWRTICTVSH